MFWIALSTLIMAITGVGDDTARIRAFMDRVRDFISEEVPDQARQDEALAALDEGKRAFRHHRVQLGVVADCIEKLDRTYEVELSQYEQCVVDVDQLWENSTEDILAARRRLTQALEPRERQALDERLREQ